MDRIEDASPFEQTGDSMKLLTFQAGIKNGFSAAPDVMMGLAFLATWIVPDALGGNMHEYFITIMLLEFITIHSAGFMAWAIIDGTSKMIKILRVIGLGIFYSLFITAFTVSNGEWWPLWTFWLLIVNRIMTVLFSDESDGPRQVVLMTSWGWGVFCFVAAIMITVLLPVPAFGWTGEALKHLKFSGKGLWFDNPQSLMAAGFLYYTAVAWFELKSDKIAAKFAGINPKIPLFRTKKSKEQQ